MKKIILLILDGFGHSEEKYGNAILNAHTPTIDKMLETYPHTLLHASGKYVGLPDSQPGNSEVGHLNIGAGRIVYTGLSIINNAIENNSFSSNVAFNKAIDNAIFQNSKLHLIGLFSDGGVHSSLEHIIQLTNFVKTKNVKCVFHCITDGRDVPPKSFLSKYLPILEKICTDNIVLGTISGRYYGMDRDKNWDREEKLYDVMVGKSNVQFSNLKQYVLDQYEKNITDEFFEPAYNANNELYLSDNDSVIMFNYRPDRARQLAHMIFGSQYYSYTPSIKLNNICLVTMMKYEGIIPSYIAFEQEKLKNIFGEVISNNNLSQLRISETEKYAHVTFFFDGGKEIDFKNEKKIIIPSPKVTSYDLKPEMSCEEITTQIINNINNFDIIIANFPNCDMVGHTANYNATIKAVEYVDGCVKQIFKNINKETTTLFITADHGNADIIFDKNNNPHTAHTSNQVPLIITDNNIELKNNGSLANIVPTILDYLKIKIPNEMTNSIIKDKNK